MDITFEYILLWVLIYSVVAIGLQRSGYLPSYLSVSGPLLTTHSNHGLPTVELLSKKFKPFWKYWGTLGVFTAITGLLLGLILFGRTAIMILMGNASTSTTINQPKNYLVIPGVNDFLPASAAVEIILALFIGMVVHEGGHAIMCRISDIDIDSTGFALLALIPIGAFVEPDKESQSSASRVERLRMFAGGIMNNMAVVVIAFILLVGPLLGLIVPVQGGAVNGAFDGSPADKAGIEKGDVITQINGNSIKTADDAQKTLSQISDGSVSVTLKDGETVTVNRGVFITSVPEDMYPTIDTGETFSKVNGEDISSVPQLKTVLSRQDSNTATVTLANGEETTVPVGALAIPQPNTPAGEAFSSNSIIITAVDNEQVISSSDLLHAFEGKTAGETVTVTAIVNGNEKTYTLTLNEKGNIGVQIAPGISGIGMNDFGVTYYPKETILNLMTSGSILQQFVSILILPFASLYGQAFTFPGFVPYIANFYTVTAIPTVFEGAWLFSASLAFWLVWINLNLAIFNCLPTYPLDGGHITNDTFGLLADKLNLDDGVRKTLTYSVVTLTLLTLAVVLIIPTL